MNLTSFYIAALHYILLYPAESSVSHVPLLLFFKLFFFINKLYYIWNRCLVIVCKYGDSLISLLSEIDIFPLRIRKALVVWQFCWTPFPLHQMSYKINMYMENITKEINRFNRNLEHGTSKWNVKWVFFWWGRVDGVINICIAFLNICKMKWKQRKTKLLFLPIKSAVLYYYEGPKVWLWIDCINCTRLKYWRSVLIFLFSTDFSLNLTSPKSRWTLIKTTWIKC